MAARTRRLGASEPRKEGRSPDDLTLACAHAASPSMPPRSDSRVARFGPTTPTRRAHDLRTSVENRRVLTIVTQTQRIGSRGWAAVDLTVGELCRRVPISGRWTVGRNPSTSPRRSARETRTQGSHRTASESSSSKMARSGSWISRISRSSPSRLAMQRSWLRSIFKVGHSPYSEHPAIKIGMPWW
jgi:hypothetical protein